ncbi:hypothetical protein KRX57_03410 [Weeksellaceae bacterium TAE3-ERU29]|nr:hypothetical protein [Weeksellaceae bacterium TAE3-ERU29]
MKKILLIIFVLTIKLTYAECGVTDMSFYPENTKVSLNSMFIIEGYGWGQEVIKTFNKRKVYLETETGEKIDLKCLNIYKGYGLSQAIFKPIERLKPNTKYFLKWENLTEIEITQLKRYNIDTKNNEDVFWETTDEEFTKPLNSRLSIKFKDTEVIHYGCGPSVYANFEIENKNNSSEVWYKTELVDLATNKKSTYYLISSEAKLGVGHGMCAGGFGFSYKNRDNKYKVRFTPMNTDGKTLKTTQWITFINPFKQVSFPYL